MHIQHSSLWRKAWRREKCMLDWRAASCRGCALPSWHVGCGKALKSMVEGGIAGPCHTLTIQEVFTPMLKQCSALQICQIAMELRKISLISFSVLQGRPTRKYMLRNERRCTSSASVRMIGSLVHFLLKNSSKLPWTSSLEDQVSAVVLVCMQVYTYVCNTHLAVPVCITQDKSFSHICGAHLHFYFINLSCVGIVNLNTFFGSNTSSSWHVLRLTLT